MSITKFTKTPDFAIRVKVTACYRYSAKAGRGNNPPEPGYFGARRFPFAAIRLFVYARPRGVLPPTQLAESKLSYAKQVFAERYRQSIHSQQNFSGVVVIFLGGNGGIAAATLRDIKQWIDGGLAEHYFIRRCSLDPPEMFNKRTP